MLPVFGNTIRHTDTAKCVRACFKSEFDLGNGQRLCDCPRTPRSRRIHHCMRAIGGAGASWLMIKGPRSGSRWEELIELDGNRAKVADARIAATRRVAYHTRRGKSHRCEERHDGISAIKVVAPNIAADGRGPSDSDAQWPASRDTAHHCMSSRVLCALPTGRMKCIAPRLRLELKSGRRTT